MKNSIRLFLREAFETSHLDLSEKQRFLLERPKKRISIKIPFQKEDGTLHIFTAYRVQHSDARGPLKGGLRLAHKVDLEHFEFLASLMTWKSALANIPFGGAKGGINCDPKQLNTRELKALISTFTHEMIDHMGPLKDIPAPDVGTSAQEMGWIFNDYSRIKGYSPGVVTGKPISLFGLDGRKEATGYGVMLATLHSSEKFGLNIKDCKIAIQGFGNVGRHAALFLNEQGAKITAISDSSLGVYSSDELDISEIYKYFEENSEAGIESLPDNFYDSSFATEEILSQDCDILIPAAIENTITAENVDQIRAQLIVEAANMPISYDAHKYLSDKGVVIVPDIFANAGGVIASYYEWIQSQQNETVSRDEVFENLDMKFAVMWAAIQSSPQFKKDIRSACYNIAITRVYQALQDRGIN